ncbi:hypothetical protein [Burkholderia ubonensis]|uniref:hypothetical protein n=1 Tax=Burkholderia ubonensis TaxID=101571 RepID=UPI0007C77816|nr:hypothetical protein [Burkholderia ubonensis]
MNCKPGDLAVTTGMVMPENNDVIVEVQSLGGFDAWGAYWNVKHRLPMRSMRGTWCTKGQIHDCNLRPISGVPVTDDVSDEVTA